RGERGAFARPPNDLDTRSAPPYCPPSISQIRVGGIRRGAGRARGGASSSSGGAMKAIRRGRRVPLSRRPLWVFGAVLLGLVGCSKNTLRLQAEDDGERADYSVETINQWAMFDGADSLSVFGVGLVTGLANTGGEAPPGDERTLLEKELKADRVTNIKEVLSRKDATMVVVSAVIPPGAQKGDPIDVR